MKSGSGDGIGRYIDAMPRQRCPHAVDHRNWCRLCRRVDGTPDAGDLPELSEIRPVSALPATTSIGALVARTAPRTDGDDRRMRPSKPSLPDRSIWDPWLDDDMF